MNKKKRILIDLIILSLLLFLGSMMAPGGYVLAGSPESGGNGLTLPNHYLEKPFMFRGQTLDVEFWGMSRGENGTIIPQFVDFYVMNAEQYLVFCIIIPLKQFFT